MWQVNLVGIDIFTGKKYEDICPSTHNMEVPKVSRNEFTVVDIDNDGYVSLMNESGDTREDLRIEGDIGTEIKKKFEDLKEDQQLLVSTHHRQFDCLCKDPNIFTPGDWHDCIVCSRLIANAFSMSVQNFSVTVPLEQKDFVTN